LLAARKMPKIHRQKKYIITTDIATLTEKNGGKAYVGKLRSNNLLCTEYTLYNAVKRTITDDMDLVNDRTDLQDELTAIILVS
jgi:hypothetical protein